MVWWKVIVFFSSIFSACSASDFYSDDVLKYDAETFKQNIGGDRPHFVNFFAPWCGYCKRLKPVWDEFAEKYNIDVPKVVIAKVDCTVETPLCAEQGISGYPSLIFYNAGKTEGIKFKGKRELAALEEFIRSNIGEIEPDSTSEIKEKSPEKSQQGALELSDDNFHSTIDWGLHFVKFYAPWCGHCQKLAPIWDDLASALEHDSSVTVSKIDCTGNRISCSEFEVKGFPTLLWIVNGKKVEKYQGQRTLVDLKRFITDMKKEEEKKHETEDGKIPDQSDEPVAPVVHLTEDNFENAINQGLTFVKFYAPWCGHCRRLAPTWDELARKFVVNTNIKVAKVDCTADDNLCNKYKVQGYPTLFLFKDGKHVTEYNGLRDLEALHDFIQGHLHHDEL